jgi:hypothetical protein
LWSKIGDEDGAVELSKAECDKVTVVISKNGLDNVQISIKPSNDENQGKEKFEFLMNTN